MDSAMVMERMYYIIDGRGNYYRTNEEDQLIVSQNMETADLFELKEANQRINTGMKRYFYSILPADRASDLQENVEAYEESDSGEADLKSSEPLQYDLEQMDWKEYLLHFSYVISSIKKYQDKLNNELSEVDMCICDLMHYLELYDLEEKEYLKAAGMIKYYREKRRAIKDKAHMTECFQKTIGTNANLLKAKEGISLINKLERRKYKPRVLSELFAKGLMPDKNKEILSEPTEEMPEQKGDTTEMTECLERRETIFDGRENDWERLASEQATFFAEAKQYTCNLQITLNELDREIEQILCQIEDANCNAAQGYKTFKLLKELRNERKKVSKELEAVQTITQCFDCEAMRDAYQYCLERIDELKN